MMRKPSNEEGSWHMRLPNEKDGQQIVIFLTRYSLTRSDTEEVEVGKQSLGLIKAACGRTNCCCCCCCKSGVTRPSCASN
jgi:hypothetical protein